MWGRSCPEAYFLGSRERPKRFRVGFMAEVIPCPQVLLGLGVQGSRHVENGWEHQHPRHHQTPRRHHSALALPGSLDGSAQL